MNKREVNIKAHIVRKPLILIQARPMPAKRLIKLLRDNPHFKFVFNDPKGGVYAGQ